MNKKGFTMIEMIVTVTLLCTMLLIIVPSILSQLSARTEELSETEQNIIIEACKVYVSKYNESYLYKESGTVEQNTYCIPISELKKEGLYTPSSRTKYFGNDDNYSVNVVVSSKTKTYSFENKSCS